MDIIILIGKIVSVIITVLIIYALISATINTKKLTKRNENLSNGGISTIATIQSSQRTSVDRNGKFSLLISLNFKTNDGEIISSKLEITLSRSILEHEKYSPGSTIKVIYNPNEPTEVLILEKGIESQY
ncbi:hypothetical protein Z042_15535 [Chania multitudinisentens RB-25]|uniref:DUF3592 domain-containing protein n=1 Tax=Chania multitudinisentens RB-25 TaxID=1441930 RepID=W0LG52_9GAMM|nr:DUF3592 domain-containing protein [Chania multitudinisentens]AHG22848.1 hypothetical protein Z042_15535 [Chania multitudinisentens RB-25]